MAPSGQTYLAPNDLRRKRQRDDIEQVGRISHLRILLADWRALRSDIRFDTIRLPGHRDQRADPPGTQ